MVHEHAHLSSSSTCGIFVIIVLILGVLPTALAHPPPRSHHNVRDFHAHSLSQQHLFDLHPSININLISFNFIMLTLPVCIKEYSYSQQRLRAHNQHLLSLPDFPLHINITYLHAFKILYHFESFI